MKRHSMKLSLMAALMGGVALPQAVHAQQGPPQLQEIVVTAQRQKQNLQTVPIAVTAFSGQTLEKMSVDRAGDALSYIPNVSMTAGPSGGDDANIFIRGVGQVDNSIAVDPGVGVYIDEVYIGRLQASSISLVDIARMEVLRGPQGTLYGRNTIGGAVNVVTSDPPSERTTKLGLQLGSRQRHDFSAATGGPIGGGLSFQAAVISRNQKGWAKNVYTGATFGDVKDLGGRLKVLYKPSDTFRLTLAADYVRGDGTPSPQVLVHADPGFLFSPTGVPMPPDLNADKSSDYSKSFVSIPAIDTSKNRGISATALWNLGWGELKSITAYRAYDETVYNDFDGTGYVLYDTRTDLKQNQLSQEFHLSGKSFSDRLTWLGGLYGYKEDVQSLVDLCTGTTAPRLTNLCLHSINFIGVKDSSVAAFGQARFAVTDKLEVYAGLRLTQETKKQRFYSILHNDGVFSVAPPMFIPGPGQTIVALPLSEVHDTFKATTPRIGFDYKLTPDALVYLSYAEGFKSGGFTGRPSNGSIKAYGPERVKTWEAGAKTELFDHRLRINGAIFSSKYQDLQLLVFNPGTGLFETTNAGDVDIKGAELEIQARPVDHLTTAFTAGYLDAHYTRLAPGVIGVTLSSKPPLSPKWTYSANVAYAIPIGDNELELRADYSWRDKVAFQIENDPDEIQGAYGLLNLRATYTLTKLGLSLSAYGQNVGDTKYFTGAQDSRSGTGVSFAGPGAPAEYGVNLNYRF